MSEFARITFKNLDPSPALETVIRERVDKLRKFHPSITSCHVTVESPHRHHVHGRLYHVHVDVSVPGAEIVAARSPDQHTAHEDVYIALRDSFLAARRQLMDHARRQRGDVKQHERDT